VTDAELLTAVREWKALVVLAKAQADTLKKTVDARDSKYAEIMYSDAETTQVLR